MDPEIGASDGCEKAMNQVGSSQETDAAGGAELLRESVSYGVIATNAAGLVVVFDPHAQRLTGIEPSTVLGSPYQSLPLPLKDTLQQILAEKKSSAQRGLVLRDREGTDFACRVSSSLALNANGEVETAIFIINDLTAIHELSFNMQRLDRLASIGTLSASMAHEIKNALVAITTFVEDLIQRNKDSELASLVSREMRRVDSIVSQMLKFSGPAKPTFAPVSVHRILDHSLRLIQPQLETKEIRLRRSFTARPDRIEGDDYQLEQAFLNIFLNALAAMSPKGQLSVSTELTEVEGGARVKWLQVSVTDTGSGIPPENLSRLFEPFFSTKPQGTGLGLAITRRIIMEHRGKLSVESRVNEGSTFRALFPLGASEKIMTR